MDKDDCLFVSLCGDYPGLRTLIQNWKDQSGWDAKQYAREFLSRAALRRKLWLTNAFLCALAAEVLWYGVEAQKGYSWILLAWIVVTLLVRFIPNSTYGYVDLVSSIKCMRSLRVLATYCATNLVTLAKWDPSRIELCVENALVGLALEVRKLEVGNKNIPKEHWENKKQRLVAQIEDLYDAAAKFGIAEGGYGRYYKKADNILADAA